MERVVAYVDGFNLYFGLKAGQMQRYYWLDIPLLVNNLLKPDQSLVLTKYFTARVSSPPDKVKRQATFIEALETCQHLKVFEGHYQTNLRTCKYCGRQDKEPKEKMTDVHIAVEMIRDAFENRYDTAFLVSADSDLVPPIEAVKALFPEKRIVAAFPPNRYSSALMGTAHAYLHIGRAQIAKSLFHTKIKKADGSILHCPNQWR